MSILTNNRHETTTTQPSPEPHAARRAVRYTAASNAQSAIIRQFPTLFVAPLMQTAVVQAQKGQGDDPQAV